MIHFKLDENGNKIKTGHTHSGAVTYAAECEACQRPFNLTAKTNAARLKCKCEKDLKVLTYNGETKTISEWCDEIPTLNYSTMYQRYQARKSGKIKLSDAGVLFGKRQDHEEIHANLSDFSHEWERELIEEFNKALVTLPLAKAVIRAVSLVSHKISFTEVREKSKIFSDEGLRFEYLGTPMLELFEIYENSVEDLKEMLRDNNFTEIEIQKLFV